MRADTLNIIKELKIIIGNKKIFIYGYGTMGGTAHFTLHRLGYVIEGIVDSDEKKWGKTVGDTSIISPYDLMYYDKNEVMVFVCSDRSKKEVVDTLESMKLIKNENFSTFFLDGRCAPFTDFNPQIGWCRGDNQLFGGDSNDYTRKTILTLGGSTTDYSLNGFVSWPSFLQNMINNPPYDFSCLGDYRVINGGAAGYCSSHEVFSLIVYGLNLAPNVLITYSGYNDSAGLLEYEYNDYRTIKTYGEIVNLANRNASINKVSLFFGREVDDYVSLWLKNAKIIHGICEEFGIRHIHILQPSLIITDCLDDVERDICCNGPYKKIFVDVNYFYKNIKDKIRGFDWIFDFTGIFKDSSVYLDSCHVNEDGNKIIASEVCKILIKYVLQ